MSRKGSEGAALRRRLQWEGNRAKLLVTRGKIAGVDPYHGDAWRAKMLAYYDRLIREHDAREPPDPRQG